MHTKNWKPLSVSFGSSLSLYCTRANDIKQEVQFKTPTYTFRQRLQMRSIIAKETKPVTKETSLENFHQRRANI